jgi:phosphoribosylamine--glycine ligase
MFAPGAAVCVVMASRGYPAGSSSGDVITGVEDAEALDGVHVVQAGTALRDGQLVTAGGRVLAVVGTGVDVAAARAAAYDGVGKIAFDGAQHRTDIAAGR